ncbi:hypothetical protein B0H10DRAFT_2222871 [Mycena sp. CBHHK59/15]|nr:hypothetical protein B0H10DRAFT_2222871 [Mycena sp. CBHHK59/15]
MRTHIAKKSVKDNIQVIELPRDQAYGVDELVKSLEAVYEFNNPNRGATHCEAGLLASIAYNPSFSDVQTQVNGAPIPIGVAKKCCPACRHLADVLEKGGRWKFDLPGSHARWHPWVPPHWLPTTILQDLDHQFLSIVSNMVTTDAHLATSKASDGGAGGPDYTTGYNLDDGSGPMSIRELVEGAL